MEQTEIVNQAEALDEKNAFAVYNHIELETAEEDRAVLRDPRERKEKTKKPSARQSRPHRSGPQ